MIKEIKLIAITLLVANGVIAKDKLPFDTEERERIKKEFTFFDAYDPWERFNRKMYNFNRQADSYVIKPAADAYQYITPDIVEKGIHNAFNNIMELPVLWNSIFQLKGKKVWGTTKRFVMNTTVGVLGLWDPATEWCEMMKYNEDFGQTLGHYGVPKGPYLVLPILGPSTCRDGAGLLVDKIGMSALYPSSTDNWIKISVGVVQALDTRSNVKLMYGEMNSMFEYEKLRSLYLHARDLQVTDAQKPLKMEKQQKKNK